MSEGDSKAANFVDGSLVGDCLPDPASAEACFGVLDWEDSGRLEARRSDDCRTGRGMLDGDCCGSALIEDCMGVLGLGEFASLEAFVGESFNEKGSLEGSSGSSRPRADDFLGD